MRLLRAIALLLLAPAALAAPPLGDLTISSARVPDWYMPTVPDTSGWAVTEVHAADCADNGTNDRTAIADAITAAAANTVLLLDSSCVYNIASGVITLNKSNVVIRGGGISSTIIKIDHTASAATCGYFTLENAQQFIGICSTTSPGTAVNWTAGTAPGDTVLTVADTATFAPDQWVRTWACYPVGLKMAAGDECAPPNGAKNSFIAQVTARSVPSGAGTITLDRGLLVSAANNATQRTVTPITVIENAGIEDLKITSNDWTDSTRNSKPHVNMTMGVGLWLQRVHLSDAYNNAISLRNVARSYVGHGRLSRLYNPNTSRAMIYVNQGAVQNAIVDNVFDNTWVSVIPQSGAQGNIIAYNYQRYWDGVDGYVPCDEVPVGGVHAGRSIIPHGYTSHHLYEANDFGCKTNDDQVWGPQGYTNTWFRNRVGTASDVENRTHVEADQAGFALNNEVSTLTDPISVQGNWLLNVAATMLCTTCSPRYFDASTDGDDGGGDTVLGSDMWLERNLVWGRLYLQGAPYSTSVDNVSGSDASPVTSTGWTGVSFPASLVYTSKPSWWTISSPWPGIGADVDTIGGTMHKLPAQCRYEGSTTGDCAPYSAATPRRASSIQW